MIQGVPGRRYMCVPGMLCIAVFLVLAGGCKIEITVPPGGKVVSKDHVCQAGKTCTIDVKNTLFDQTFTAVPGSDPEKFTGWKKGFRHFCGGQTVPCRLFTTTFGDNEALLVFLQSDEDTFYLAPTFENISDNFPSGATPVILKPKVTLRGNLGSVRASHDQGMSFGSESDDSDYYVFVAPTHGDLTLTLTGLQADLDLSLEGSGVDVLELSDNSGTAVERITTRVSAGMIRFINVFSWEPASSPYILTLNFKSDDFGKSEVVMAGTYKNASQLAQGQCDNGAFIQKNTAPATMIMDRNGRFTLREDNQTRPENSLVYRKYASDGFNRTIARQDVFKNYYDNGQLAQVVERNIAGHVRDINLYAEITERTTKLRRDGSRESDCILYWPMFADLPEQPPDVLDPMQPQLLRPAHTEQIPQNNAAIGCPAHPTRGYGLQIDFDWSDAASPVGIMGYHLVVKGTRASSPWIDTMVTASKYTFKACNSFVDNFDSSVGFNWTVQAQDKQGNFGPVSDVGFFITDLCILEDGNLCFAN